MRPLLATALFAVAGCTVAYPPAQSAWRVEAEDSAARVGFANGVIDIDTPRGLTLWWRQELTGPVAIQFEAMAVSADGANDQVSDLNAFWMASNADGSSVMSRARDGAFAEYDDLRTYYVGIGGNRNTTTRFRRYIGRRGERPLLPAHDRGDSAALLMPNRWMRITLIAEGGRVAVHRDGARLFEWRDPQPYTSGNFAFRTTQSHWRLRNVRIQQLPGE